MAENKGTTVPAGAVDDEDFYDDASAAFPQVENLAPSGKPFGPGRLVAIWALENGSAQSKTNGKAYGYTETITLVLDDGPDGNQVDELIGHAPVRVEMRHSTTGLHSRLRGRVEGVNAKGIRLKYRPMIGRVNTQASSVNKNVAAYSISEATDADREVVNRLKDVIIGINRELEAKDQKDADSQAFD